MAYVSRDPFARTELHKSAATAYGYSSTLGRPTLSCDWCGSERKASRIYRYRTETDGGRSYEHRGFFCSVSCFRSYHEV